QARCDDSTNQQSSGSTSGGTQTSGRGDGVSSGTEGPGSPSFFERPVRPDQPDGASSTTRNTIKELTEAFKLKAVEFHQRQVQLAKSLADASSEDRARIRDEMKANRDAFAQIKDEFRDQVRDTVAKLKDQKQKLDDETKDRQSSRRGGKQRA